MRKLLHAQTAITILMKFGMELAVTLELERQSLVFIARVFLSEIYLDAAHLLGGS